MGSSHKKATRKRRSPAWIPDQHGAWFMVTVPAFTGFFLYPSVTGIAVLSTWLLGYFAFFAASVWMRSKFLTRHRPAVFVYAGLTTGAGILTLIADWTLIRWIPFFLPLVAVAVWETYRRRPRSLLSGVSTVVAACLMVPVVASAGMMPGRLDGYVNDPRTWAIFGVYLGFFVGTVPYVKTLIRNRGSRAWYTGSVAYHVVIVLVAFSSYLLIDDPKILSWAVPSVAAVLLARAAAMPIIAARRGRPWQAKTVGMLDAVLTALVVLAAV